MHSVTEDWQEAWRIFSQHCDNALKLSAMLLLLKCRGQKKHREDGRLVGGLVGWLEMTQIFCFLEIGIISWLCRQLEVVEEVTYFTDSKAWMDYFCQNMVGCEVVRWLTKMEYFLESENKVRHQGVLMMENMMGRG